MIGAAETQKVPEETSTGRDHNPLLSDATCMELEKISTASIHGPFLLSMELILQSTSPLATSTVTMGSGECRENRVEWGLRSDHSPIDSEMQRLLHQDSFLGRILPYHGALLQ